MLYTVAYSSRATTPMSEAGLEDILAAAHRNNEADGITGVLIYADGYFLQILEGPRDKVDACLGRIETDPRHESLTTFGANEIEARAFDGWRMAYLNPSPDELAQWAGLEAAETTESLLAQLEHKPERMPQFLRGIVQALA